MKLSSNLMERTVNVPLISQKAKCSVEVPRCITVWYSLLTQTNSVHIPYSLSVRNVSLKPLLLRAHTLIC